MEHINGPDKTTAEALKDRILSNEEYALQPYAKAEDSSPYVFELQKGDKKLTYFGSPHIAGSESPIFEEIKNKFDEANPAIVYVEGMEFINKDKQKIREQGAHVTETQAKEHGEGAFTLKLAIDAGIDFESPEPDFSSEIASLLENEAFSRKDVFEYYAYRSINQYQRVHAEKSIEECRKYIRGHLDDFARASGWPTEETENLEREVFQNLNVSDEDFYAASVDPIPWPGNSQSKTNAVARASSVFRDRYIFEKITEGLKKYDHVFVVYGAAHAVKEEPAFRALFESVLLE